MGDLLGREGAVSVGEALRLLFENLTIGDIPELDVPVTEAFGRVLACEAVSPEDLPGFSRSTMDGFAVSSADTFGATETAPAYVSVSGEVPMGRSPELELSRGQAARISTGGMLPSGADAVVMLEHVQELEGGMIEVQRAVAPGENVIMRGEDLRAGQRVLGRGRLLRPHDVAVLAGSGFSDIRVYRRPSAAIISTGDEVVPAGRPVEPGQVRDMNSVTLAGLLSEDGCIPIRRGIVRDELEELREALEGALEASDAVLISGGSSVGARDLTEKAIAGMGDILFHSVSMKPGKPLMAGIVKGKAVYGLPGHPRAVSVCYDVFIRPVMKKLAGMAPDVSDEFRNAVWARLARSISSSPGRQEVFSVALVSRDGALWAEPVLGKSGLLNILVKADGTITVPAEKPGLGKGETVRVRLL
ncbi:MAG: molybdopterin molybdotransferase MoeA [Nitrospirota bacterium]|jgi:molybdopterin molybdotransferase